MKNMKDILDKASDENKTCRIETKDRGVHTIKQITPKIYGDNKIWCLSDYYLEVSDWMAFVFEYDEIVKCEIL